MDETSYLLSSSMNTYRLHQALNRDRKARLSFNDVDELEDEIRNKLAEVRQK